MHGVHDDDIRHAVDHYAFTAEVDSDEPIRRTLYVGPDRAGNLLEIGAIERDGSELIIHAMRMRRDLRSLLPGWEKRS